MTQSDTLGRQPDDADAWRRRELAAFLRSRRVRLSPEDHGLSEGRRRRTTGLRREEMAMLLDVSVSWYTKLEQGVDVTASPRLLGKMADVLMLSPVERGQLLRLGLEEPGGAPPPDADDVLPSVQMIIDAMHYAPAFVLSSRADYIACNQAARAFFGNFEQFAQNNQLISLFLDDAVRAVLPDWQESARSQVAMFRRAFARNMQDQGLQDLVRTLLEGSEEFRALWEEYALPSTASRDLRYSLPNGEQGHFRHFTFFADLENQFRVEVFNPIGDVTLQWMIARVNAGDHNG
ncbi:putative DNA-binding protein [Caenibius tardaugens NBRC 16725]|uniref:Putative DNA-binding protein n=1 Tax=Caenibius tardaugens NBRC 16725 TaxID=1219035 RepID=U2YJB9_9SPHN|nr:helix-turn-helix transcriptional regulator [Caenibius tardaugens]AZI34967.1 XRE family transcriptional regulator [Caenibius tardaugens NBRC 16725]GAD48515.1 putative DNA-binding protein [Caenibius tardaugens NBRC 16725]